MFILFINIHKGKLVLDLVFSIYVKKKKNLLFINKERESK